MVTKTKQPAMARRAEPRALERGYARELLSLVKQMREPIDAAVARLVKEADDTERKDAAAEKPKRSVRAVKRALKDVPVELDTIVRKARPGLIAQGVDARVTAFALKGTDAQISKAFRGVVTLPDSEIAEHKAFVTANVRLITSIKNRLFSQVEDVVSDAWVNGKTTDELTNVIEDRFEVTRSRARLIARDQVGKLNGNVEKQRHKELGIDEYTWSTSRDERVRDTHRVLEGRRFRYDDPPDVGNPGEDYQCRCQAIPWIEDLDFPDDEDGGDE